MRMREMCLAKFFSRPTPGRSPLFGLGLMGLIFVSGCAGVRPAAPLSPQDPASPEAMESSTPPLATLLTASDSDRVMSRGMGPDKHEMGTVDHENMKPPADAKPDSEVSYFCPMHPKVKTSAPGSCPICNMKLVKKKPEPPITRDFR